MKTNKSVENVEVTPSKKKLTQARLPFKLISEDAKTPVAPQSRKRKLSADETEPAPKGKICKENDIVEDLVVISDDESKDGHKPDKAAKPMNPFVKLVDTAWKKKLQKGKSPKSRRTRKRSSKHNNTSESVTENDKSVDAQDEEQMDVDTDNHGEISNKDMKKNITSETKESEKENKSSSVNDVVVLEDSNPPSDISKTNEQDSEKSDNLESQVEKAPLTPKNSKKSKSNSIDSAKEKSSDNELSELACKTPSRKAKSDAKDKLITPTKVTKLNESVCSSPSTPKGNSRSSSVTNSLNDSVSESTGTSANLTPKQLQKKLESAKKREEREKEKQERERKRQEEKEERARQKQEKEDAKKREREEKEEQRRKEKEEKEKQRELEKKLREEKEEQKKKEREEKEEQRRKEKEEKEEQKRKEREAKEEEKRKKQEALELEKQEQELKKKKAAEAFVNFFVPKQKDKEQPKAGPVSQNSILSSFTIKGDMRLAPLVRAELSEMQKKAMESLMNEQKLDKSDLYLKNLKKEGVIIGSSGKTWPLADKDDEDCMVVEDELPPIEGADEVLACEPTTREKLRPKLFSFHENKRPPYWGTWRKKSVFVKPRRPFGQEKQLDYDVDSDEDWEEEQEGESLDGSRCGSEDEQEPEDEYEVDNEVFVPHGYLSDEEATMDEEDGDVLSLSPETQKARLKNLEDEFESEMKKPTEKLKPRLYGLMWETEKGGKPEKCVEALWNYFGKLSMIMDDATIANLLQPPSEPQEPEKKKLKKKKAPAEEQKSPKIEKKKKVKPENKETKKSKPEPKQTEVKKNQPGINSFLTKLKSP